MNTSKKIKDILDRKENIERLIASREKALSAGVKHNASSLFFVQPKNHSGAEYGCYLEWDEVEPLIINSINKLKEELASINKKLDAIASLMGVSE